MEYTKEQIEAWKQKAEKWDKLEAEVLAYYETYDEEGNELEPEKEGDLGDIGEVAARAFGFL